MRSGEAEPRPTPRAEFVLIFSSLIGRAHGFSKSPRAAAEARSSGVPPAGSVELVSAETAQRVPGSSRRACCAAVVRRAIAGAGVPSGAKAALPRSRRETREAGFGEASAPLARLLDRAWLRLGDDADGSGLVVRR